MMTHGLHRTPPRTPMLGLPPSCTAPLLPLPRPSPLPSLSNSRPRVSQSARTRANGTRQTERERFCFFSNTAPSLVSSLFLHHSSFPRKLRPEIIIFPGVTVSKSAAARCWSSSSSRGAPPPSAVISAGSWVDSCLFMRVCATATSDHPFVLLTTKALSKTNFTTRLSHTGVIKQCHPYTQNAPYKT